MQPLCVVCRSLCGVDSCGSGNASCRSLCVRAGSALDDAATHTPATPARTTTVWAGTGAADGTLREGRHRPCFTRVMHVAPFVALFAASAASAPNTFFSDVVRLDDPADCAWNLRSAGFLDAWELLDARGVGLGAGVVVGLPDTGWFATTSVPVVEDGDALGGWTLVGAVDIVDGDDDAWDDLRGRSPIGTPGHASHAASVIVGRPATTTTTGCALHGAAPAARVLPIRATTSTGVLDEGALARGIDAAVRRAHAAGVVVVAAAGNMVPFVIFPAAYPEVIAVAATGADDAPSVMSSFGPEVDVSAPGDRVLHAFPHRDADGRAVADDVIAGVGTTLSIAHAAGLAPGHPRRRDPGRGCPAARRPHPRRRRPRPRRRAGHGAVAPRHHAAVTSRPSPSARRRKGRTAEQRRALQRERDARARHAPIPFRRVRRIDDERPHVRQAALHDDRRRHLHDASAARRSGGGCVWGPASGGGRALLFADGAGPAMRRRSRRDVFRAATR